MGLYVFYQSLQLLDERVELPSGQFEVDITWTRHPEMNRAAMGPHDCQVEEGRWTGGGGGRQGGLVANRTCRASSGHTVPNADNMMSINK